MKNILLVLITFVSFTVYAAPVKPSFHDLAVNTVKSMYGRSGDQVVVNLVSSKPGKAGLVEVWDVTLSNGAAVGSANFQVTITKSDSADEGKQIASIVVKYLGGT